MQCVKKEKYLDLIKEMSRNYRCVKFVNLSMISLGALSEECSTFLDVMNNTDFDKKQQFFIIKKMIDIAIRATYYIFCCRNRNWDSPDLNAILIWFDFLLLFFLSWTIQSKAVVVNCLYVTRFTIVHSKTHIKFPLLLLLLLFLRYQELPVLARRPFSNILWVSWFLNCSVNRASKLHSSEK